MSGGSSAPSAPNMSGNVNTANSTSGTATSDANQTFNTAQAYNQNAQNTLSQVNGANTPMAAQVNQTAGANLNSYQSNFMPLQQQQVQQAQNYTSANNTEQLQSQAVGDSNASLQASLQNQRAQLASEGVDPASVHGSALDQQAAVQGAASNAQAANQSYLNTQQTGMGLVSNANQLGMQVGQAGTTGAQAGTGINSQALANVNSTNATGVNNMTAANPYLSTATNANQSSANIANTQFQDQLVSQQANQAASNSNWAGIGTVGGIALGEYANSEGAQTGGPVSFQRGRLLDMPQHAGGGVLPRQAPNMFMRGGPVAHYDGGGPVDSGGGFDTSLFGGGVPNYAPNGMAGSAGYGNGQMGSSFVTGGAPMQTYANASNWDSVIPQQMSSMYPNGAGGSAAGGVPQASTTQIPTNYQPTDFGANAAAFGAGFASTQQSKGGMAGGGIVTSQGALPQSPIPGSTDTKPAWLTPGEFVIPHDAASWKGHEHWFKQIDKARAEMNQRHGLPPPAMPSNMTSRGR